MEILQFLLSFFSDSEKLNKFTQLLNALKNNCLDFNTIAKNIDLKSILPVISQLFFSLQNKSPTDFSVGQVQGLTPICDIADKDIVFALNKYLGQDF